MNLPFIAIDNRFLNMDTETLKKIHTEGFTLYCYVLMKQGQHEFCEISIKMIQSFFRNVKGYKDRKSIEKILKGLIKFHAIKIINLDDIKADNKERQQEHIKQYPNSKKKIRENSIGINTILQIQVNNISTLESTGETGKGFTAISEKLFIDKIKKIGHIGWTLLCILTRLHNKDFGNIDDPSNTGFANPKEEYLSELMGVHRNTIADYTEILEKQKLISVERFPAIEKQDMYGNIYYTRVPNQYKVRFKYNPENKYYIKFNEK